MTFTNIVHEIKDAYLSGQPLSNFYNQLNLYQANKKDLRPALISGCFSYVSFLPFFIVSTLFVFIPKLFIVNWELNSVNLVLYSQSPVAPFLTGMILSLILRDKVKWILPVAALMQYIQATHMTFTLFLIIGLFLGLVVAHAIKTCIGISKIKVMYLLVNLTSWALALWGINIVYSYLVYSGLLASDLITGRSEMLSLSIGLFVGVHVFLSALWGHFYIKIQSR